MRRGAIFLLLLAPVFALPSRAAHHRDDDVMPLFKVAGVQFALPSRWVAETADMPDRVGQWQVPPPRDQPGEPGEILAIYFGPGVGGTARENIAAWKDLMSDSAGKPLSANPKTHTIGDQKISELVMFGTYSETVPIAGIPPLAKPDYGLIGVVVESPQGNIFFRFTGPEPLVTANLPLFDKMIDSVKPQDK